MRPPATPGERMRSPATPGERMRSPATTGKRGVAPAGFRTLLTDQSVSVSTNRMADTERRIPDPAHSPLPERDDPTPSGVTR